MICSTMTAAELVAHDLPTVRRLFVDLTWPGSDFSKKLHRWLDGAMPEPADGTIAVVSAGDSIVGWARTELWIQDHSWRTLEAFVDDRYRSRGVATLATAALVASGALPRHDDAGRERLVAVFRPAMMLLARRAGLVPVLFEKNEKGVWVRV